MKHAKKFASLLLALVMVFAMSVTTFAEGETGSIKVKNTVKDADYTIYRLFDLESYAGSGEDDAHSYKVASKWSSFFANGAEGRNYFDVDSNGYVTVKDGADMVAFTQAALKYAQDESIENDGTQKGNGSDITFNNLELGYYLVDSSVGALCALTTTDPDGEVIEKNANPTLDKDVKEDSTNEWGDKNDAEIGEEVEFRATITVQGYAKNYVMHDKMDDGLTYGGVTKVTLNGNDVDNTDNKAYTVESPVTHGTEPDTYIDTFDVIFTESFCNNLKTGDVIVVYYKATLNDNAVVTEPENNNAHLEYKDNNNETHNTPDSNTETYTWKLPVLKYANGDTIKPLADAKFSLYTDADCTDAVKFHEVKETGKTTVYRVDPNGTVTEITTDSTGKFIIEGLDAGTYYLKETEAPAGYNKLNTVVTVTIDHAGQIDIGAKNDDGSIIYVNEVQVENNSGTELPSTGGMGTTIFYVLGSILVLGAAVLLITRKRMSNRA